MSLSVWPDRPTHDMRHCPTARARRRASRCLVYSAVCIYSAARLLSAHTAIWKFSATLLRVLQWTNFSGTSTEKLRQFSCFVYPSVNQLGASLRSPSLHLHTNVRMCLCVLYVMTPTKHILLYLIYFSTKHCNFSWYCKRHNFFSRLAHLNLIRHKILLCIELLH